jgi:hypothetical protein
MPGLVGSGTPYIIHTEIANKMQVYQNLLFHLFFIVPSHALLYTFETLKSHTKTLKIHPYMFPVPLKPSSGSPWPYFARLPNWNVSKETETCRGEF